MLANKLQRLFPWLSRIDRTTWPGDLGAGLLGAILALPQGVAFATLAGLPPKYGVYGAVLPCAIAAIAGSSRHVITGPTNANSLALFAVLSPLALPFSQHYIDLALAVTVMVGVLQLLVAVFRIGAVANFISPSVLMGFMSGAAILIGIYSLKDVLGVVIPAGTGALGQIDYLARHPSQIDPFTLAVGIVTLAATLTVRHYKPRWPSMLFGVLTGTAAAFLVSRFPAGAGAGVAVVGHIPSAIPPMHIPQVSWTDLQNLSGLAAALTLVALGQSVSIAKAVAVRSGQRIDVNREFLGQGLANAIGGFFSSYISCGSLNRSMPNLEAGAKTPLAAVFAAAFLVMLVVFFEPVIAQIPLASIAAMLLLVAYNLVDARRWATTIAARGPETAVAAMTLIATLTIPLDRAVLLGTLASLVAYLYRTSRPAVRVMLPDPADPGRRFIPLIELPAPREECPQLKLIRIEGSVFFGAVAHVSDNLQRFRDAHPQQKHILFMTKSMNFVDLAGVEMWEQELRERRAIGGDIYFHRPRPKVLEIFEKTGFLGALGQANIFRSKKEAIATIYEHLDLSICLTCPARVFAECDERRQGLLTDPPIAS